MAAEPPSIGHAFLHYRIVQELGAGGMGVVYRARDERLDRPVALKFLSYDLSRREIAVQRFEVEAKAAASLDHINIGTVYGVEETEDGRKFIVMAFYDGETLARKIKRGPIRVSDAVAYSRQIARGLSAAHRREILHRDIKPSNVVVTNDGIVKIVDFGIARFGTLPGLTNAGDLVGTPAYMSPEQALGETVDHRTDIWSLGVVLFEMVTGLPPFRDDDVHSTLYKIVHAPLPSLGSNVPVKLIGVISKALSKDPLERYSSATALDEDLADLEQLLHCSREASPSSEKTVTMPGAGPRFYKRKRIVPRCLAAVLLILGGLLFPAVRHHFRWPLAGHAESTTVHDRYLEATTLIERRGSQGNLDKAINLLHECIKADPTFSLAHAKLGEAYLLKYRVDHDQSLLVWARESAQKALSLNKDSPTAYITLGSLDDGLGQHELAVQEFQLALQIDARSTAAYQALGKAYDSLGRPTDAETMLRRAVDLDPESWQGYSKLGAFYFAHERLKEAIVQYHEVVRLAPDNALGYSNLGAVLLEIGQPKEAIGMFQKSVQISPSSSVFSNLGTCYYRAGDYSNAAQAYERALGVNDKDFNVLANLAICYRRLFGFNKKTRTAYQNAQLATEIFLKANSKDPEALGVLANLKVWLGQGMDAERLARQALVLAPDSPDTELSAASVFEHEGDRDEAIRLVISALQHGASRDLVYNDLDLAVLLKDQRFVSTADRGPHVRTP